VCVTKKKKGERDIKMRNGVQRNRKSERGNKMSKAIKNEREI